ncbi:hypothetical protein EDB89DRAFT_2148914 [Lactarius sanguifluus]|nr:hypothetical protein EDB89DRAFT_2148914 [Lactarius sanguifluus]
MADTYPQRGQLRELTKLNGEQAIRFYIMPYTSNENCRLGFTRNVRNLNNGGSCKGWTLYELASVELEILLAPGNQLESQSRCRGIRIGGFTSFATGHLISYLPGCGVRKDEVGNEKDQASGRRVHELDLKQDGAYGANSNLENLLDDRRSKLDQSWCPEKRRSLKGNPLKACLGQFRSSRVRQQSEILHKSGQAGRESFGSRLQSVAAISERVDLELGKGMMGSAVDRRCKDALALSPKSLVFGLFGLGLACVPTASHPQREALAIDFTPYRLLSSIHTLLPSLPLSPETPSKMDPDADRLPNGPAVPAPRLVLSLDIGTTISHRPHYLSL